MANYPMQYAQSLSLPLTQLALQTAQQFAQQQPNPLKAEQVYLNTLAVWIANEYLQLMGVETNLTGSDSWNPVVRLLADVADLVLATGERLECRPVRVSDGDRVESCRVPPEVWEERLGYLAIAVDVEARMGRLLGFSQTAAEGELFLEQLQPLEQLLEELDARLTAASQPTAHLSQWLQGRVEADWQTVESLSGNPGLQPSSSSNLPQNLNRWFEDLDDLLEAGWQSVEALFGLHSPPAVQFRSGSQPAIAPPSHPSPGRLQQIADGEVRRAKLLDFGVQLGESAIALAIVLSRRPGDRVNVRVQVHPLGEYLPPQLQLALVSEAGEILQSVTSRGQDLWMQLPAFNVQPSTQFRLQISLGEMRFSETFSV